MVGGGGTGVQWYCGGKEWCGCGVVRAGGVVGV